MAAHGHNMSIDEARQLLNLLSGPPFDPHEVEQAYLTGTRKCLRVLKCPSCHEDRDRANDTLDLLKQAKALCLASSAAGGPKVTRSAPPAGRARSPRGPSRSRPRPSAARIVKSGTHLAGIFKGLWNLIRDFGLFLMSLPYAVMEIWDFSMHMLEEFKNAGIPKIVVILAFLLGFMTVFKGCAQGLGKFVHMFGK